MGVMLQIPIVFVNKSDFSARPKFPAPQGFFVTPRADCISHLAYACAQMHPPNQSIPCD
jgi:hypothetical protein